MSTSYKPALLKAIVRVTRAAPAARIALEALGAEFLHLYWVQTVVFRLRQAATLKSEPEVVREIRSVASVYKVRDLRDLPPVQRAALARRLARVLKINVLEAFHTSKPESMEPLFTWDRTAWIALTPEALAFVHDNAPVLEAIANLWWARYLEKVMCSHRSLLKRSSETERSAHRSESI